MSITFQCARCARAREHRELIQDTIICGRCDSWWTYSSQGITIPDDYQFDNRWWSKYKSDILCTPCFDKHILDLVNVGESWKQKCGARIVEITSFDATFGQIKVKTISHEPQRERHIRLDTLLRQYTKEGPKPEQPLLCAGLFHIGCIYGGTSLARGRLCERCEKDFREDPDAYK